MLSQTPIPFAISAGTTRATSGTVVFSNSNGLMFGLNGNTVTGSYTVPPVPAQLSVGNSNLGNTAGDTGVVTGRLVLVGSNNVTLSGSTNGGSQTISIFGGAGGGGSINLSAGTTSNNLTNFVLSNGNGVTFGLDGSTVTASHNGLTSQSNQNVTAANGGFAFQTLSFSNLNGISFGTSAGSAITASHNALTSQSNQAFSAAGGSSAFQTLSFNNANGVSFTNNGGAVEASIASSLTNIRVSAGTTSNLLSAVTFANGNGISFGLDASTVTASHNGLTSQSNQNVTAANGGFAFQTLSFSNANNFSFGTSAGSAITGSYTTPVVSNAIQAVGSATGSGTNTSRFAADDHVHAGVFSMGVSNIGNTSGDTRVDVGRFVFVGGNNITLSQATAANAMNTITISAGAGGGGSQSIGASNLGNTSGTSGVASGAAVQFVIAASNGIIGSQSVNGASATLSIINSWSTATTVSNVASANAIGANAGRFALEGHQHAGVPAIAAGSNTGNTAGNTGSQHGTWVIAGTNNVTVSGSTGAAGVHTLWLSAPTPGAGGAVNVSAGTTSNDLTQMVFSNSNNFSFGLAGSTITGSFNAINLGVSTMGNTDGTTGTIEGNGGQYLLAGSNGIFLSQSTNGASSGTLTINGWPHISSYQNRIPYSMVAMSWASAGSISHCVAFQMPQPISASFIRVPILLTTATVSLSGPVAGTMSGSAERHSTFHAVVYSLGTGGSSRSLMSVASGSGGWTQRTSLSVTNTSQWSISQNITVGCEGGSTTSSTQYSVTGSSATMSSTYLTAFTGSRFLDVPFANSLSPGAYWLVMGLRGGSATNHTMLNGATAAGVHYGSHMGAPNVNTNWGIMGSTNLTSGGLLGAGSFSTNTNTTTSAFPMSAISSSASNNAMYFQLLRSA